TCQRACTPASVRPAQTTLTRSSATPPSALSMTAWTEGDDGCVCQPAYAVPSYSIPTAMRTTLPRQTLHQALGFLLLRRGALAEHLFENVAGSVRIAHVHVRPCQIELRAHLAHRDGLEVRQREIIRGQLLCGGEGRIRHRRRTDVQIHTGAVRGVRSAVHVPEIVIHVTSVESLQSRGRAGIVRLLTTRAVGAVGKRRV